MSSLSTHVLDTAAGRPVAGVPVTLCDAGGIPVAGAQTDDDGRVGALGTDLSPGVYRLRFELDGPFYPEVVVSFRVTADEHYHVPLLLSPFGYSTYRGS